MSEQEKNPMHFFKRLSEKSRALRQEAAEAGLGAFDSTSADKPKRLRRRRSEKPQSDESVAAVSVEKPRTSKKPRRKPQGERAESERSADSGKTAEKAEQKEKRAPRRNPRKKAPAGQLAELLKRAKLPKAHNIHLDPKAKVKIIPLGGLEQIGMNITAFECNDTIIVVDCGIAFPSEDMLGIDCVIPDISYLKENRSKVKGFVITHGHEDHIGALPYILKELNVPVYSTKLTIALIRHKLEEHRLLDSAKLFVVKHGDTVPFGDFNVEFIKTNHSISDSSALAIFSPAGVIFHTGDFKIDYTPVFGEAADLQRMAELGKRGVLAMLCDSTNAIRPGFTMSEKTVGRTFDLIFAEHQKNRIIVATFASNVDRVQQVINSAYKYGRKVVVEGRSMVNVIGIANELGYIKIPEGTLIEIDQLKNYPPEKTVLITTGSQGESMAALSRMASGMHRKVAISPNDVVIMSSHPIPGNEKAVDKVINELSIKGAEVIFQDTHVSGHACAEEIKLMYSLLRPKFALPVHGEYRHRKAQVEIAEAVGVPKENILFMSTGDVVTLTADSCKITGHVQAGGILVDGLGVGDVGNVVLRDRQNLAQNGIMIVTIGLQRGSNQLLAGPEIVSRGFVYVKDSEDLMAEARERAVTAVTDSLDAGVNDWSKLKNVVRDELSDFFWKKMKRTPVILPIILGVN
ncbi:RNase J family beta-CASP ribonuclease [Stomatobaculum longum]|uniref:ribonuclease J n=1 Tax=Stomatobaculum longum TaxID=796942 RepID=UPI0028048F97|nr:RNase J family beta-CASP ribonuclease [Stomatobaculum longum]